MNDEFITFTIAGGNEIKSRMGSQYMDASKDENSVVIRKKHGTDFEQLREAVEAVIGDVQAPVSTPAAFGAVEVARLAALYDAGHLTAEEFAAAKARALAL